MPSTKKVGAPGSTLDDGVAAGVAKALGDTLGEAPLDNVELGVVHISSNSLGQLFQVMLEVAFDTRGVQPPTPKLRTS